MYLRYVVMWMDWEKKIDSMTEEITNMQNQIKEMQEDTLVNNAKKALSEAQERLNSRCEQIKSQVSEVKAQVKSTAKSIVNEAKVKGRAALYRVSEFLGIKKKLLDIYSQKEQKHHIIKAMFAPMKAVKKMLVSMELHLDASIDKLDNLAMNVQIDKEKHMENVSDSKVDQLMDYLLDTFRPKGFRDDMEMMFDLSKEDIGRVNGIVSSLDDFDVSAMVDMVKKRKIASERTAEINRILKNSMSEEDVNTFAQKENEILKKKDDITSRLYDSQHRLEDIDKELNSQEQIRDKAMQILKSNAQNKHVYELSAGISSMMEQFLEEKTVSIRKKLEKAIVQKLKSIYRKNNLITHIEIGKNFDFNLYQDEEYNGKELLTLYKNLGSSEFTNLIGTKGEKRLIKMLHGTSINVLKNISEVELGKEPIQLYKKIELGRLSKGERQIFILALYWAIIEISGQNIPFVIDTPYARIDANHRREISEKFFPNISNQVIILSTDEEINEEYYKIVKPYISKEYLLINDENENRTTIENNYFFEV